MVVYTARKLAVQELPHQACGIETNHAELTSSVRMIVKFYTFNAICWPQTQLGILTATHTTVYIPSELAHAAGRSIARIVRGLCGRDVLQSNVTIVQVGLVTHEQHFNTSFVINVYFNRDSNRFFRVFQ